VRPKSEYPYIWTWRYRPPSRYGQRCRVVASGKSGRGNNVLIEFEDGFRIITDRRGLRKPAEAD